MKLYQVEYRAVITVEADDFAAAELFATAFIRENPHVIRIRGAREINHAAPARQNPELTRRPLGQSMVNLSTVVAGLNGRVYTTPKLDPPRKCN